MDDRAGRLKGQFLCRPGIPEILRVKRELVFHFDLIERGASERTTVCVQIGACELGAEYSPGIVAGARS
jgi:hypothetical protein